MRRIMTFLCFIDLKWDHAGPKLHILENNFKSLSSFWFVKTVRCSIQKKKKKTVHLRRDCRLWWVLQSAGLSAAAVRGCSEEPLWGFMQTEAPHCESSPSSVGGLWFQLFLISASVRQKTVLAMKYLAVPMRVESASSGSTAAECFSLDPNKFRGHISLCALEHSESVCCFGLLFFFLFGWGRRTRTFSSVRKICQTEGWQMSCTFGQKYWNVKHVESLLYMTQERGGGLQNIKFRSWHLWFIHAAWDFRRKRPSIPPKRAKSNTQQKTAKKKNEKRS